MYVIEYIIYFIYIYIYTHIYMLQCRSMRCSLRRWGWLVLSWRYPAHTDWWTDSKYSFDTGQTQNQKIGRTEISNTIAHTFYTQAFLEYDIYIYWWWDGLLYNSYIGRKARVWCIVFRCVVSSWYCASAVMCATISIIESRTTKNDSYGFFFLSFSLVPS